MNKLKKYLKRFSIVFPLIAIILSFTFCVGAINDNNGGVLAYTIRIGYSSSITSAPNYSFKSYKTYNYSNSQLEFHINDGSNGFENIYYRYLNFKLDNPTPISKIITVRYVSYYARQGSTDTYNMDGVRYAWVNGVQYSGNNFNYSRTATNGVTYQGGQFTFGMNANSTNVNVVLCAGFNEQTANVLGYLIEIEVEDYNSNQDIINNQNQNTQDILDNQNENADKINGTIDEIFNGENYDGATDEHEKMDDYSQSEQEVTDFANDQLDSVKSDLWDSNLLNQNVNTPVKGFRVMSSIFDTFLEDCPSLGYIAKLSIAFGILAFVLGLAITIYRRNK